MKASCSAAPARSLSSEPWLLVMDIDSTLIDQEVIDLLGDAAGVGEQVAVLTEAAMRGELDFAQALKKRVSLLQGLPVSIFETVLNQISFTTGALELIEVLHQYGWKIGVVSGGFHEVADALVERAGIDFCCAHHLEQAQGILTGRITGSVVTKNTKVEALRTWANQMGIPLSHTVAIGDGANDIPMIQSAGIGIAFCAKPATVAAAPHHIDERNLMHALDIIAAKQNAVKN
ncbi:phosphoserine phosphatase SerB [Collinsella sp. zg1085]|uniref:phosphoserine phosphatase SerB n=1 Tax=Collinsella sp. zg1085 TaxID=2844380 RepID=UPI001C0BF74E|nr:phosphoserine phosphatase SerB [Collinsella sp. zg1085]QWT18005.1 phosphoserine phosphatase SerB [Collinsella sp. zg1085]